MLIITTPTPTVLPAPSHAKPLINVTDKPAANESPLSPPLTPTGQKIKDIPILNSSRLAEALQFVTINHMEPDTVAIDALTMLSQPFIASHPQQPAYHRRNKNNVRSFHRMRHRLSQSIHGEFAREASVSPTSITSTHNLRIHHHRRKPIPMRSPLRGPDSANPTLDTDVFELNIYEQYLRDPAPLLRPILPVPVFTARRPSNIGGADMSRSVSANDSDAEAMEFVFENRNSKVAIDSDEEDAASTHEDGRTLDKSALDVRPLKIVWKGTPLEIQEMPHYHLLHPAEAHIASTLRLTPIQYIKCRNTLVQAARAYVRRGLPFRKSDAQKLCRVDVNKTSRLWGIFGGLGWFGDDWHAV
ncbi:hypothetical protein BC937DRAFT_86479 [Endogone sp. FLAS-F59071]|nr:hypothetical protein BC937DRAFT_86479 [Endogone sp. FLAS-F59071]|eukprot:RUS20059.1 hypothetical protein BC937DRAFT_86479 [Endogone sp. FLAS-F59071]